MDYEKKYKEALERAKQWCNAPNVDKIPTFANRVIKEIFPELKESEDERIRKSLIILLQHFCKGYRVPGLNFPVSYKDMLAWLEKQGEQEQDPCEHCKDKCLNCHNFPCIEKRAFEQGKSVFDVINEEKVDNANKVEPKFKVGDWITNGATKPAQISSIEDDMYYTHNGTIGGDIESMDKDYHLWTIQDAKDGDVLATIKGGVFIYAKVLYNKPYAYCGVDKFGVFKDNCLNNNWTNSVDNIHPATKEQRNTLMKAMAAAGYTFDFENKELKLLITNGGDFDEKNCEQKHSIDINKMVDDYANNRERGNEEFGKPVPCMIRAYRQGLNDAIGKVVLKPAWSEEDIRNIQDIDSVLFYDKSLPEDTCMRLRNWLESLRPQNTWKPSDEQLDALHDAAVYVDKSMFPYPKGILMKLYKQLKKLRGE